MQGNVRYSTRENKVHRHYSSQVSENDDFEFDAEISSKQRWLEFMEQINGQRKLSSEVSKEDDSMFMKFMCPNRIQE